MINRRFLLNIVLLTALVSGGAYYIYSNGVEEMSEMIPMAQETPVTDSVVSSASESITDAVPTDSSVAVSITNFAYEPKELRIKTGMKVIWKNEDAVKHNVLADNGEFSSRLLAKEETFEFTFNQKGSITYHCGPHPWMKATVIVE